MGPGSKSILVVSMESELPWPGEDGRDDRPPVNEFFTSKVLGLQG